MRRNTRASVALRNGSRSEGGSNARAGPAKDPRGTGRSSKRRANDASFEADAIVASSPPDAPPPLPEPPRVSAADPPARASPAPPARAPPAPEPPRGSYRSGAAEHSSRRALDVSISPSRSTAGRSGAWWCLGRTRYLPKYAASARA